jgi:outer membrane protein assembly factor BamB
MRLRLIPLFLLSLLALSEPISSLWKLDIQAEGGNSNGKDLLLWGKGKVYKINRGGRVIWRRSFKGLTRAFLLPDGQALVITKQGNGYRLSLLNLSGFPFWQFNIEKVNFIASRGKKIALTAADTYLYILTLRETPSRLRGWRRYNFHKRINHLAILQDGRIALALPDNLCIFTEGKQPLFFPFPKIERISPLSDGGFYSLISHSDQLYLSRHISSGYVLWSKEFKGNASSFLSTPPFLCLGLEQEIKGGMKERKLLVLDQSGDVKWKRGGLLLKPIPLLLSPKGELLCMDESRDKLLLFNQKGRFIWEKKCSGEIKNFIILNPYNIFIIYHDKVEMMEVRLSER